MSLAVLIPVEIDSSHNSFRQRFKKPLSEHPWAVTDDEAVLMKTLADLEEEERLDDGTIETLSDEEFTP